MTRQIRRAEERKLRKAADKAAKALRIAARKNGMTFEQYIKVLAHASNRAKGQA